MSLIGGCNRFLSDSILVAATNATTDTTRESLVNVSPSTKLLLAVIFIYTCHTIRSFLWWRKYFSAQRFSRSNPQCPSHNQYPHLAIQRHQATAGAASSSSSSSPPLISEIKRQTCPFARAQWKEGGDEASSLLRHQSHGTATATYLSMDHIYIDFLSFLWGMTFIWPCTVLAGLKGVATMLVRGALC